MEWINRVIQVFKIKELRNKILFILGVFLVFRIMANIPIPGISIEELKSFFDRFQVFGLFINYFLPVVKCTAYFWQWFFPLFKSDPSCHWRYSIC